MALDAYMTLKGAKQGVIKGSVTIAGRENSIAVHSFSQEIDSPRDSASGLPSGKRTHQPLVVVKDVDQSSPHLWQAFVTNETLSSCQLQFWETATDKTSGETQFFTIILTNASIASVHASMADNENPANANLAVREEISLVYQKIEWLWTDGNVSAQDDWNG